MSNILSDSSDNVNELILSNSNDNLSVNEQRKLYVARGLVGLINLGNTCYMNAAIQCLISTNIFSTYFRSGMYKNDLKYGTINSLSAEKRKRDEKGIIKVNMTDIRKNFKESLTYKFRNLCVIMWGVNISKIKPKSFKHTVDSSLTFFSNYKHHDSQEFICLFLDKIHDETKTDVSITPNMSPDIENYQKTKQKYNNQLKNGLLYSEEKIIVQENFNKYRATHLKQDIILKGMMYWQNFLKKNHSAIIDIFTGLYVSTIVCSQCKNCTFTFQPENTLTLGLGTGRNIITLEKCLEMYFTKGELLEDSNAYDCEICAKKTKATKNFFVWTPPSVLIILLKRFSNSGMFTSRNDKMVDFPMENLNMGKYSNEYKSLDCTYDLYGVIHQIGMLHGGHYVAYTKNIINNEWYKFDDTNVLHIDSDKIHDIIKSDAAYVLFYKKREDNTSITTINIDDDDDI